MGGFLLVLVGGTIAMLVFGIGVYVSESPELREPNAWRKGSVYGLALLALVSLTVAAVLWFAWRAF